MIPLPHLAALWRAEVTKLFSRTSARIGLVLAALIGLGAPMLLWWLGTSDAIVNGQTMAAALQPDAAKGMSWALQMRNFFVLDAILILLGAVIFAGEFASSTIREDLLRPVPRWSIVFAKWLALVTWVGVTLGITWIIAAVLNVIVWGFTGTWDDILVGYLLTWVTDAGFAALVLLISVLSRNTPLTIAGVFLFMVLDTLLGWALSIATKLGDFIAQVTTTDVPLILQYLETAHPWLPSSAFGSWQSYHPEVDHVWQSYVSLALITIVSLGLAKLRFTRMDVP